MRWTRFLMVLICAVLAFGGSFECKGTTADHDDDDGVIVDNSRR